ncbi:MAG: cytidylate kinase-like family protein [Bacillota bacterium]|nr:cytidylate kinase-like family protein [Bacillota bacterium]
MASKFIITIAREFCSGGHEIGKILAKKLNIDFYDKELISLAAKDSGIDPSVFEDADERATNSLLYSLSLGMYSLSSSFAPMGDLPVNDRLFVIQHNIIKELADKGPCVIVGRCADYVLRERKNCIKIFIHADPKIRTAKAIEVHALDPYKAEAIVHKTDKTRANYYSFYSEQKWGFAKNFDLCLDSGKQSLEESVELIESYIKIRERN